MQPINSRVKIYLPLYHYSMKELCSYLKEKYITLDEFLIELARR